MLGHSHERDGLSPIPTVHRDGLGSAPGPPFFLGMSLLPIKDVYDHPAPSLGTPAALWLILPTVETVG